MRFANKNYFSLAAALTLSVVQSPIFAAGANASLSAPMPIPAGVDAKFLRQLNKATTPPDKDARAEQFGEQSKEFIPATPEEGLVIKKKTIELHQVEVATEPPLASRVRDVPWTTGSPIENIRMASGFQTKIFFFDSAGKPINIKKNDAGEPLVLIGNGEAIGSQSYENLLILWVKVPWQPTNVSVMLEGFNLPVEMLATTELEPSVRAVDITVKFRARGATSVHMKKVDLQNTSDLLAMASGIEIANAQPLNILSIVESSGATLDWHPVNLPDMANVAAAGEQTYVVLKKGFRLLNNGIRIMAQQTGADGSTGYLVVGNNPRTFVAASTAGLLYRITVGR